MERRRDKDCGREYLVKHKENRGELVIFKSEDGQTAIEVTLQEETSKDLDAYERMCTDIKTLEGAIQHYETTLLK
jgi:tRNA(Ile2) C34 agmatinyltransferase TiaS